MIKFKNIVSDVFSLEFHSTRNAGDYVRENGVYLFEGQYDGKKVEVKFETAQGYHHGDYSSPTERYGVSEAMIDGEVVDILDLDQDLQDAINDLKSETEYDSKPESYTYSVTGNNEENFGESIDGVTYEHLEELLNKGFVVVGVNN